MVSTFVEVILKNNSIPWVELIYTDIYKKFRYLKCGYTTSATSKNAGNPPVASDIAGRCFLATRAKNQSTAIHCWYLLSFYPWFYTNIKCIYTPYRARGVGLHAYYPRSLKITIYWSILVLDWIPANIVPSCHSCRIGDMSNVPDTRKSRSPWQISVVSNVLALGSDRQLYKLIG